MAAPAPDRGDGLNGRRLLSSLVLAAAASLVQLPAQAAFTASPLAAVPVQYGGRLMPFETFSRLLVQQWSGKTSVDGLGAGEFVLLALFQPGQLADTKLFLVNNPEVFTFLTGQPGERRRYSWKELQTLADSPLPGTASAPVQTEWTRLKTNVGLLAGLAATLQLAPDSASVLRILPPSAGSEVWLNPGQAAALTNPTPAQKDGLGLFLLATQSWKNGKTAEVSVILGALERTSRPYAGGVGWEVLSNRLPLQPAILLLAALVAAGLLAARRWSKLASGWPVWALGLALGLQTLELLLRMLVTGRPPVTSLSSSFGFIAWAGAAIGLVMHAGKLRPWGLWTGSLSLLLVLFFAGQYGLEGDRFPQLQAVLDSNFWLGTHVLTVTLGYGLALAAGVLGHLWLIRQFILGRRGQTSDAGLEALARHLRTVLVLGLLFTAAGTFLGGIWADQSWGRFWGWDPKENGALLILLWLALTLHARSAGLTADWGTALLAVLGIQVVLFSWFGINFLGVGLHSYGFTQGLAEGVLVFSSLEGLFAGLAILARSLLRRRN